MKEFLSFDVNPQKYFVWNQKKQWEKKKIKQLKDIYCF